MTENIDLFLDKLKIIHLMWIIVVVPCFFAVESSVRWAVVKVVDTHKKEVLNDVKELLMSEVGQKILSDSFDLKIVSTHEKIADVKKDIGNVAIDLKEFTGNYYSRLQNLVDGLRSSK